MTTTASSQKQRRSFLERDRKVAISQGTDGDVLAAVNVIAVLRSALYG